MSNGKIDNGKIDSKREEEEKKNVAEILHRQFRKACWRQVILGQWLKVTDSSRRYFQHTSEHEARKSIFTIHRYWNNRRENK